METEGAEFLNTGSATRIRGGCYATFAIRRFAGASLVIAVAPEKVPRNRRSPAD